MRKTALADTVRDFFFFKSIMFEELQLYRFTEEENRLERLVWTQHKRPWRTSCVICKMFSVHVEPLRILKVSYYKCIHFLCI